MCPQYINWQNFHTKCVSKVFRDLFYFLLKGLLIIDQPCKFPFTYNGITHHACIYDEKILAAWCATAVTSDGVLEANYWGYCSKNCPRNQDFEQSPPGEFCHRYFLILIPN